MKKYLAASAVGLTLIISSSTVVALDGHGHTNHVKKASSEKQANTVLTFRKSLLQLVRSNMGPLGAMAKGNIPMDADTIALNAERIEFLGTMMHDYFKLDTSAYDIKTEAKDNIWLEFNDFNNKADDMVKAAADLQMIVEQKQEANYRKGIGALGGTCKACHDKYKAD